MKNLPNLAEELVDATYALEKIKYPNTADRHSGWVKVAYCLAWGLEYKYTNKQLKAQLQKYIDETNQEMSDLCGKVEL